MVQVSFHEWLKERAKDRYISKTGPLMANDYEKIDRAKTEFLRGLHFIKPFYVKVMPTLE